MTDIIAMEPEVFARLQAVMRRLYAPTPLTADERRDLANTMEALLRQAQPIQI